MRFLPACAVVLSITVPLGAQSLEPRVHDLGPLLRRPTSWLPADAVMPFVSPYPGSLPRYDWDEESGPPGEHRVAIATGRTTQPDPITDWLMAALHRDGDPGVIRAGEVRDGRWLVEASAAVQQRLARRVADLEAAALRSLDVEVFRLPAAALVDAPLGVLDRGAAEQLLADHPPQAAWRITARCGEPVVLRSGEVRSILHDFEIEVAEDMVVGDPTMDVLPVGLLGSVLVARAPRGGAVVTLALRRTEELDPERVKETEFGNLRMPQIATELYRTRADLREDGAILLGAGGARASAWLVRVRGLGGRRPDVVTLGGVGEVPWRPFDDRLGARPLPAIGEEFYAVDAEGDWPLPDEMENAIADHDEVEDVPLLRLGDALVASRESSALGRLEALATAFAASRAVTVRYGVAVVDAAIVAGLVDGTIEPGQVVSGARWAGRLPTRTGDLASVFVGVERTFLRDYDVEIASGATGTNPIVDSWFEGAFLDCVVEAAQERGSQRHRVRCAVAVQLPSSGAQELHERSYDRGLLDAPQIEHARAEVVVDLGEGEWRCAAVVPIGILGQHLAVVLRID